MQEEFLGWEGSIESIKTQYRNRIQIFKNKFGYDDGKTSNLSDEAGDLGEVDGIIKSMLHEESEADARKEALSAEKEKVNQTEYSVLLSNFSDKSKKKIKLYDDQLSTPDACSSDGVKSNSSSKSKFHPSLDIIGNAIESFASSCKNTAVNINIESKIESKIMIRLNNHTSI